MKSYFYLKNPQNKISSIEIVVCVKGQYFKIPTGESLPKSQWDKINKCSKSNKEFPDGYKINARLEKLDKKVKLAIERAKNEKILPDKITFKKWILNDDNQSTEQNLSFINYLQSYIDRVSMAESTKKKYITTINKLKEYEIYTNQKLLFDNINIFFYENFKKWFYSLIVPIPKKSDFDEKEIETKKYSKNYFGSIVKIIKKGMKRSYEDKLHNNNDFNHSDFKIDSEPIDSVYLSIDELKIINNLEITAELLKKEYPNLTNGNLNRKLLSYKQVKNIFIIGAYTGLRVSDYKRLSIVNFNSNFLSIKTNKTGQFIIVPIHPIVKEIIKDFDFSKKIYEQKINQQIKRIAKIAGINSLIQVTRYEGGKKVVRIYPKYKLITTHTARRSAATNMFKAGITAQQIMKITGHRTESSFMKYLRISTEENAEMLSNHRFFNE